MTIWTFSQLEQLWINADGPKDLAPVMAAIALAESGGNDQATNLTDNNGTQTSWGLWQISNGTHSWPGSVDPLSPYNNAAYAVQKYHVQGLQAWGTYTSGAYREHLSGAAPTPTPADIGGSNATTGGTSSSGSGGTYIAAPTVAFANPASFDLFGWHVKGLPGSVLQGLTMSMPGLQILTDPRKILKEASSVQKAVGLVAHALALIGNSFQALILALTWIMMPQHWLRIGAGLLGFIVLIVAVYMIATSS